MAIDLGLRIMQLLDSIGIKGGSYLGKASNVKKAFTGGKPTFFKPDALQTLRATDGTFTDALNLIEEEAMFIANATDAEKMAFLNNLMEYKSLGGPQKTTSSSGIASTKAMEEFKKTQTELQKALKDLQSTTEKNKNKALQDLDDFFETGGQPFKKKDNKFLGGSMHEEGQLRTGIREFLQTEYKNGKLKLDELDVERIMKHSPMLEHDPIKVFKKIYGDEAYTKAGSFPGAFEKGENYKHYEQIFRENMGDEVLQIKNNEYKGDGKLVLTEREEVFTPTPDDDVPFAEGGIAGIRQGYFKGKVVKKVKDALNQKNIKKAVDNIFKSGDYKYDASMAAESFVELNPQLFGGKLYDDLDEATQMEIYGAVLPEVRGGSKIKPYDKTTEAQFNKDVEEAGGMEKFLDDNPISDDINVYSNQYINKLDQEIIDSGLYTKEEWAKLGEEAKEARRKSFDSNYADAQEEMVEVKKVAPQMTERLELKAKYPGITDDLLDNILIDDNPQRKAEVLATIDEAFKMMEKGKGTEEIIETFKNTTRTKQASGGLAAMLGEPTGYYTGGMVDVEPNLSDIGHGSDALMARTRLVSPDGQATTSTGLNYLLAEDNDNIRVPFNNGKVVKRKKGEMGPSFETNDPKAAIKEIIQRLINVEPGRIPLSENTSLMFDLDRAKIGGEKKLFGGEIQFGINKGFGRDDLGYGFNFKKEFAEGGIAGLRQGYSKGKGVDIARRGFLKVVGGTVGAIAALKSGALKLLGKSTPKAIPKIVEIGKGSGVPDWFEPMVNKVLADGLDITKGNAIVDGQVVKRIDTPNGKVDVYHNQRSGEIDVEYASESHAALGDSVHLNYKPSQMLADEGVPNPPDEFMASENIPEGKAYGPDDYEIEMGENTVDEVGGLFSDTSELEKLGGKNVNMREILKNIEKKKKLKQMDDNASQFVTERQGDFIQFDDIDPNIPD